MSGRIFLDQVLSKDKCVLLKDTTQWRVDTEIHKPSVSSQALYHWATALPILIFDELAL